MEYLWITCLMITIIANCERLPSSRPSTWGEQGAPVWIWALIALFPLPFPSASPARATIPLNATAWKRGNPPCADRINIKSFLPNFPFNERSCRRKLAEWNCVGLLLNKKVTRHTPPPPFLHSLLPLNGPKKPIASPYIFSSVLCIYSPLSNSSWFDGWQAESLCKVSAFQRELGVWVSHLHAGKQKYWESLDSEGEELW